MTGPELLAVLARFAEPGARESAAAQLASALGVDRVLLFVRDPEVGSWLPAPGFPQTLRFGPSFRAFLRECRDDGSYTREIELDEPAGFFRIDAFVQGAAALFALGRERRNPRAQVVTETLAALPLVGAVLSAEHAARLAQGQAAVARATGRHANDLAIALDAARMDVERALAESARLNAELEERDRRKDDFLAMLGHELRNPMAAISGAIEVMRSLPEDAEQMMKARHVLERQAEQLAHLVDDLLDVARITRGKVVLKPQRVDVATIARRAIDAAQSAAAAKGHELVSELRSPVHVNADPTRLEQMVANLLTNAIKYTDSGGHIRITVDADGDEAVIAVRDDGIGIPASFVPRIFDAFHQVDPDIDRSAGGLGVGLTVVRRLAELHRGRVDVESVAGKGSTFTIRLPTASSPESLASPTAPDAPSAAANAATKLRVLVVDDNVDSGEMLLAVLESWGHEAHHVADGPTAVRAALELRPELVLLDIGLPGMDGFEVAARLRADPVTRGARIVALSGYGQESDRVKSRAAGCDDHLVKPVDMALLRRTLTG